MGWCKTSGKVHSSFEIYSAWSVSTVVCTLLCKDAHQMHGAADSGCNETAQLMCKRSNRGLCRLRRKSWHCGYTRVMGVLLGLMHCWRWNGQPYIPVCPSLGRNLRELSAEDLSQPDFSGVWMPTSAG